VPPVVIAPISSPSRRSGIGIDVPTVRGATSVPGGIGGSAWTCTKRSPSAIRIPT
jgi:hypothetical protein